MNSIHYMQARRYTIVTLKYFLTTATSFYLASQIVPEELLSISFIAVLSLQPNLYRGLKYSWTQFLATVFATVITATVVLGGQLDLAAQPTLLTTSIAMGLTIFFCLRLGLDEGTVIALFTVAYLTAIPLVIDSSFLHGIFLRYLTIVLGIGTAAVFNFLSSLFRYRDRLFLHLVDVSNQLGRRLQQINRLLSESAGELPDRDKLNRLLNNFNPVFKSLRDLRKDLDEIAREIKFFGRDETTRENQLYKNQLNVLNDISHYVWDLLLNLLNYRFDRETTELIENNFAYFTSDISLLFKRLKKLRPAKRSLRKKVRRRVEQLNNKMNEIEEEDPAAGAPMMAVYSDLIHLNLNLLQLEKDLSMRL